jgi:hypothetical protein
MGFVFFVTCDLDARIWECVLNEGELDFGFLAIDFSFPAQQERFSFVEICHSQWRGMFPEKKSWK